MKISEITENTDQHYISAIQLNCQRYLDDVGGLDVALKMAPLWRGILRFNFIDGPISIAPVNQNRRPTSNSMKTQQLLDDWFNEKFGIRFRQSSVFCTGNFDDAASYGTPVIVLPIGEYHYCYSKEIPDLFIELQRNRDISATDLLDRSGYVFDTGIMGGIASENEIMLHCKNVMIVDPDWVHRLSL